MALLNWMPKQRFNHIISLGQSCQTIYQIKRHYKIKDTNFFDNKRTSIELLTALLNSDFKDLILPSNLSISDDREYIIDDKYNFWLRHEFRNEEGIITDNFMDLYPTVRSKFDYLTGKFKKLLDGKGTCLFIFHRNLFIFNKYEDTRQALELEKALKNRAPRLIPKIVYIDTFEDPVAGSFGDFSEAIPYDFELEDRDGFYQDFRKYIMLERWKGSDQAWENILKHYQWSPGILEWLKVSNVPARIMALLRRAVLARFYDSSHKN